MKISGNLFGLEISSRGMSIQRKKMDLISQNIANADSVRTESGEPYKRKMLTVLQEQNSFAANLSVENNVLKLSRTDSNHINTTELPQNNSQVSKDGLQINEKTDTKPGEVLFMPEHPDADEKGYVQMSNVNIINEMVDMIAATRSYEANLQALNSSKQMIKDSLEI
ncbi:MAG: flagellar basal body rod protein FlgC [Ignavibacteriales bacterium]|nr:flagellar basal body rod protein FlgC [Ignavibacteriales bacterium]